MRKWHCILFLVFGPNTLLSQSLKDSSAIPSYSLMFNVSTVFYTAKDTRINSFLTKYNYNETSGYTGWPAVRNSINAFRRKNGFIVLMRAL